LEVKRQALAELQRAVAAAEARACEAVQAERVRLERVFIDSRRNAGESLVPVDPEVRKTKVMPLTRSYDLCID